MTTFFQHSKDQAKNAQSNEESLEAPNPLGLFHKWLADARTTSLREPMAMTLATVDERGMPSARVVLLKAADEQGFVFYTNMNSPKAIACSQNPNVALCFFWDPLGKQVRIEGRAERLTDGDADSYFATRPRESQIGAWASKQSQVIAKPEELMQRMEYYQKQFAGRAVVRPPHWSGFRIVPERYEFWTARPYRVHDRVIFALQNGTWQTQAIYP